MSNRIYTKVTIGSVDKLQIETPMASKKAVISLEDLDAEIANVQARLTELQNARKLFE